MKIVINSGYSYFGLSKKAVVRLKELGVREEEAITDSKIARDDPRLVQVVEELGESAHHRKREGKNEGHELKVVNIPDELPPIEWCIQEHESGQEWIAEIHRCWS